MKYGCQLGLRRDAWQEMSWPFKLQHHIYSNSIPLKINMFMVWFCFVLPWLHYWFFVSSCCNQVWNFTVFFKASSHAHDWSCREIALKEMINFTSTRDHFVNAPSQWEMMLHCKVASHWLYAYTKWSLQYQTTKHNKCQLCEKFRFILLYIRVKLAFQILVPCINGSSTGSSLCLQMTWHH